MTILLTVFQLFAGFLIMIACGYGLTTFALKNQSADIRWAAIPTTGFAAFCTAAITISGNFDVPLMSALWPSFLLLVSLSIAMFWVSRTHCISVAQKHSGAKVLVLVVPTLLLLLWPLLVQGLDLYLGSANLDFFQSLIFQEILRERQLSFFASFSLTSEQESSYLSWKNWPDPLQARFGAVAFSSLLADLLHIDAKQALTLAISLFSLCFPLSIYVFSRVVLAFERTPATLAAILSGIASPVALGFLIILVGQGSGMPVLPLLISALFLAISDRDVRVIAYAALLVGALFFLYAMMLPFAIAPMGLLMLIFLGRGKISLAKSALLTLALLISFLILWAGMAPVLLRFFDGLRDVGGRLVGSLFFVDFLTEQFFIYILGIAPHHFSSSGFVALLPVGFPENAAISMVLGVAAIAASGVIVAVRHWSQSAVEGKHRFAFIALIVTYSAVWCYFTFVKPYGYSLFKMASWLQFMIIPFVAHGMVIVWIKGWIARKNGIIVVMLTGCGTWCIANFAATLDYSRFSFGIDRERGRIINAYGMGNNPDVPRLGDQIASVISSDASIGLTFTDTFQGRWAAHRLAGLAKQSYLTSELFPEDDSYLPHPQSGMARDSSGMEKYFSPKSYDSVFADYLLLPGFRNLNQDLIRQELPVPLWESDTYRLYRFSELKDFLFSGRGFYRSEFLSKNRSWWVPDGTTRWTRNGWEIYLLHAARPGKEYRLVFDALVGYGNRSRERTLEFWHGGNKIGDVVIDGLARVISPPFFPNGKLDRITVRIKEDVDRVPRNFGVWHRALPNDARQLNALVSNLCLQVEGQSPCQKLTDGSLNGRSLIDFAYHINGVSPSGWIGKSATIAYLSSIRQPKVIMTIEVPGNLGFQFPFALDIEIGRQSYRYQVQTSGRQEIIMTPGDVPDGRVVTLAVRPSMSKQIIENPDAAHREEWQSIRIVSIELRND